MLYKISYSICIEIGGRYKYKYIQAAYLNFLSCTVKVSKLDQTNQFIISGTCKAWPLSSYKSDLPVARCLIYVHIQLMWLVKKAKKSEFLECFEKTVLVMG